MKLQIGFAALAALALLLDGLCATTAAVIEPAQVKQVAAVLPAQPAGFGEPITTRAAWASLAVPPSFPAIEAEPLGSVPEGAVVLHADWQMREAAMAGDDGAAVSRAGFPASRARGLEVGASSYLVKPFKSSLLLSEVSKFLTLAHAEK